MVLKGVGFNVGIGCFHHRCPLVVIVNVLALCFGFCFSMVFHFPV